MSGIYRGPGGTGDAVNDSSSETRLAVEARDAAIAAKVAAEAARDAALTAETNAELAETNAETAETNAETAEANAETAEANAEAAQAAAEAAQAAAEAAQVAAELAETNAELAETNAETAETNAETAASLAQEWATKTSSAVAGGEFSAKYHAQAAASSATDAQTAENNAETAQAAAEAARDAALASLDSFDDRYLGTKSSDPTLDNDGNALVAGALYFNTVSNTMKVYTGTVWVDAYADGNTFLAKANNLSDLTNAATARTNLGLGTAATTAATDYATSAQGTKADTALQPATIGVTVQGYDADLAAFALKTAPTGAVVGTSDTQTLTNKTISADNNTLSGIAASSFVLSNGSGNIDGSAAQKAIPSGVVVGTTDTQTLTNKTIDGASNTLTNLPLANITEPVRHSVRPSLLLDFANTKTLDPRITFTRASTGTYYDGKTVAKAEENLLLQSQAYDNASWTKTASTVTSGATSPDGTASAFTLTADGTTSSHNMFGNVTTVNGLSYTFSCFVKAGTNDFVQLATNSNGGNLFANFQLSTATAGTTSASTTSSIVSVGNSWYRCSMTATVAFTGTVAWVVGIVSGNSVANRESNSLSTNILVWGAQLEQRSSVTAYTVTTTQQITNYIPALQTAASGVARFEHNPVTGESLGLEIEEQRTNLLTYSEQFDNAAWTKSNSSITANTIVAPDGTLTGEKLVENTATASHFVRQNALLATAVNTFSVYAKAAERNWLVLFQGYSNTAAWFNLSTGTVGTVESAVTSASITPVGNGWYRCSVTSTLPAGFSFFREIYASNADNAASYAGNGFSGIYIWGAQLEAGSFATSYIPTVASQVTRSADSATMTGTNFSSWYRADEGTVYTEASVAFSTTTKFALNDTTSNNRMNLGGTALITANGSTQANMNFGTVLTNVFEKSAFVYAVNDFASVRNGGTVATDTSGVIPVVTRAQIGAPDSGVANAQTIKKVAYYAKRLTNAEIQSLTTV